MINPYEIVTPITLNAWLLLELPSQWIWYLGQLFSYVASSNKGINLFYEKKVMWNKKNKNIIDTFKSIFFTKKKEKRKNKLIIL